MRFGLEHRSYVNMDKLLILVAAASTFAALAALPASTLAATGLRATHHLHQIHKERGFGGHHQSGHHQTSRPY